MMTSVGRLTPVGPLLVSERRTASPQNLNKPTRRLDVPHHFHPWARTSCSNRVIDSWSDCQASFASRALCQQGSRLNHRIASDDLREVGESSPADRASDLQLCLFQSLGQGEVQPFITACLFPGILRNLSTIGQPFPGGRGRKNRPEAAFSDFAVRRTGHIHLPELSGGLRVNHPRKAASRKWGGQRSNCSPGERDVLIRRTSRWDTSRVCRDNRGRRRRRICCEEQPSSRRSMCGVCRLGRHFCFHGGLGAVADRHRFAWLVACGIRSRLVKARGTDPLGNAPFPSTAHRRQPRVGRKAVTTLDGSHCPAGLLSHHRTGSQSAAVRRVCRRSGRLSHSACCGLYCLDTSSGTSEAPQIGNPWGGRDA